MKIEDFVEFRFLKPKPCLHCSRSFSYLWSQSLSLHKPFQKNSIKCDPNWNHPYIGALRAIWGSRNRPQIKSWSRSPLKKWEEGIFWFLPVYLLLEHVSHLCLTENCQIKKQTISNKIMKWKCFSLQAPTSTRFTPCLYSYEPFSTFSSSESQDQSNGRKPFCCDILFLLVSLWQSCTGKMRWRRGAWQTYVNTILFRNLKERKKGRKCVDRLHQVQM